MTTASSARSLFEASAYRVASHEFTEKTKRGQPDVDHGGLPGRWATTTPEVSELFADNAQLTTQDKQTLIGKTAVLRRLDKGVEMLAKMAGKDAPVPDWDMKGPVLTESLTHEYKLTIKRGALKVSFCMEFMIVGGKIQQLKNTRQ